MEEEVIVLDYPETMEHLLRESVDLLMECCRYYQYMPVSLENRIKEHLDICTKLGWKPNA